MTNQQGAPEALRQILLDPENQPNQYGVQFLMHGPKMAFKIGARQFTLDYEPDEPGEFEFMRDALVDAFSVFTPDVKMAQQPAPSAASKAVLAAIRAANMQLVQTGDDAFMLVTYKQATAQADRVTAPAGATPLPLLVRDIAADFGVTPAQICLALVELGFGHLSVNMAITPEMAEKLREHFAAPTPKADSQHAQSAAVAVNGEQKALKALHYYMTECSGHEPSLSVFHRMVEEALAPQPSPSSADEGGSND